MSPGAKPFPATDGAEAHPVFADGMFLTSDQPGRLASLLDETWRRRQAVLVGLGLAISERPQLAAASASFGSELDAFTAEPNAARRRTVEDPVVHIRLKQSAHEWTRSAGGSAADVTELVRRLEQLADALARVRGGESGGLFVPGPIALCRFDVEPAIAEVAPPTYTFPDPSRAAALDARSAYTLDFFAEVVSTALERITSVWPELGAGIVDFVKTIVHLPDGDFRSASASRYAGVIFLSADDPCILDVEESLVHECGHQILYRMMELDPVVANPTMGEFRLPWSGAKRDFYGYFHAFFIYLLLAQYFSRITGRAEDEQDAVRGTYLHIVNGLRAALPDFEDPGRYTDAGRCLAASVRASAQSLVEL